MITLLIDTSNLCYISYYAFKNRLPTTSQFPTTLIYGVLTHVLKLSHKFKTNKFIWAVDSKSSYRKRINNDYKNNRNHNNEIPQQITYFTTVLLKELGFKNVVEVDGYEADDVIAGYTTLLEKCVIVSNDKDFLQCLNRNTKIYDVRSRLITTRATFRREYKISPKQWKLVKAIGGCTSDNVIGVPGVGEKTAIKYVTGTLDTKIKKYKLIEDNKKLIEKSKKLTSLPFNGNIDLPRLKNDKITLSKFKQAFTKYELKFFLNNMNLWKKLCASPKRNR